MNRPYEWTLTNGLRVVYAHHASKASFTAAIATKGGAFYEPADAPRGLAHFTEHMCFDGTKNYPDKEKLVDVIENVGGEWNGSTGHQGVQYYAHVLGEDAEKAFEFVSEIFANPLLREEDLSQEKRIIKEEILASESDPWEAVNQAIRESFRSDPRVEVDIAGTVGSVASTTLEDIKRFYSSVYTSKNSVLGLCGSREPEEVKMLSEKYFGHILEGEELPSPEFGITVEPSFHSQTWQTVKQVHLSMVYPGYSRLDPRSPALAIAFGIFGGGASSRLFRRIREREALCYMIGAYTNAYHPFGWSGVVSGLSSENLPQFVESYMNEVKIFLDLGPTEEEFIREKKNALTQLLFKSDSTYGTATFYAHSKLFRPDLYHMDEIAKAIEAISKEDVLRAAEDILLKKPIISLVSSEEVSKKVFKALLE